MTLHGRPAIAKHTRTFLAASLLLLAALGLAVGARRLRASASDTPSAGATLEAGSPAQPQRERQIARIESELITITPHGFEPVEITRPRGQFLLAIDNRSGLAATALQLTSEAGPRIHEMRVSPEEPNWADVVDLQPGRYVLTDANHPKWICRITITD